MDHEMASMYHEIQGKDAAVDGRREGSQEVAGLATVSDRKSGGAFEDKQGRWRTDATAKAPAGRVEDWQVDREVLEATDRERNRIGRDLHDTVQGNLVGIGLMVEAMKQHLTGGPVDRVRMMADIDSLGDIVRQTIRQTRGIVTGLCPVDLAADGMARAISVLVSTTTSLFGVDCRFRCERPVRIENEAVATQLYYIAHEAVNNACKHAKARSILITIESARDCLTLTVADDGIGLPEHRASADGMGLRSMHCRAKLIGATLEMHRGEQHGATVKCSIPVVSTSVGT